MAVVSGPSAVTDSLVFSYDMSNIDKSWKGEPTVNLFATNLAATNATRTLGITAYNGWQLTSVGVDTRLVLFNGAVSVSASTFYTLSCVYWSSNNLVDDVYLKFTDTGWPESSSYIQPFTSQSVTRNGSFSITSLGNGWNYCVGTFQTLATTTTLDQVLIDSDITGIQVFITNIQLEQKTYATPFVAGTRSNTQALLDQTNRSTITATDVTYSSNNTFSFNGGTQRMDISNSIGPISNNFTIAAWANSTDITATQNILSMNAPYFMRISTSRVRFNVFAGGAWLFQNGTTVLSSNTWYYFTMVYDFAASLWIGYINGVQEFSVAKSGTVAPTSFYGYVGYTPEVGEQSNFLGRIDAVQYYNRALSAAEVLQNYHSTKSRYGL